MAKTDRWQFWRRQYKQFRARPPLWRAVWTALGVLVIISCLYLVFALSFIGRTYPNVRVGGVSFTGLTNAQVKQKLTRLAAQDQRQPVKLTYLDRTSNLSPSDVSWQLDVDQTASEVLKFGREGNPARRFFHQLGGLFIAHQIQPVVSYDADSLDTYITNVTEVIDQPAVDASAKYVGDKLVITHEKVGKKVNRAAVEAALLDQWSQFRPGNIKLETEFDSPKIVLSDETELRSKADTLAQTNLTLTWPGGQKNLGPSDIHALIDFVGIGNTSPQNLTASFTETKSKSFVESVAGSINQPAKEAKLGIQNGAVVVTQASQIGQVVDLEPSAHAIYAALIGPEPVKSAALTLEQQLPVVSEQNLPQLGIKELIGRGETSYGTSPANRKANIANGVSILQSALVKPGDEFSTVKTLGTVDDTTGFLPELVIKDNQTTPEFGGGLCQVSTTLFRAVLNAGLKVTERQNHSYRVPYYEPPIGLDATIYLPKPDFRFLNDTGAYILIQGHADGNKIVFELWGTKDGRTSTISTPIVTNITDPPDPIYAETDTLPAGVTKQIERAHQGATAVVTYTVTRNGQVINQQTFKSVYKPWQARFLVGTHVDNPPPVQPPSPTP